MTLPTHDTIVTYSTGALSAHARVLHVATTPEGRLALITDVTSIHPVDAAWPDQPADVAVVRSAGGEWPVRDAVVAATDGTEFFLGVDIPVRRGSDGWAFLVAHLLDAGTPLAEGDEVELEADASVRRSLSIGHTACHAASLALNRALAGNWSKPARQDALGSPDFDGIAIASSRITPEASTDTYRLNKSLRRAGFDTGALAVDGLDALAASVEAVVAEWAAAGADVQVVRDGERLTDRRYWECRLPEGVARIACGGTHAASLAELGPVTVRFELADDQGTPVLAMHTRAHPQR